MLEQQLINAFMKLVAKTGNGDLIRDMIQHIEQNGNPKVWTALEIERATRFINDQVSRFSKPEAVRLIQTLKDKYNIADHDLHETHAPLDTPGGVQGLV